MKHTVFLRILMVTIGLSLTACGKGYQAATQKSLNCPTGNCDFAHPEPSPEHPIEKIDLSGTVSAGPFGTHKVVDFDKINNLLVMSLPLPINPFGNGLINQPIPKLPGATIAIEATSSGYALVVRIPIKYVVKGVEFADVSKLPNGNPLPGVPGGELPKLGLKIYNKKNEAFLYLGKGAVGVFVPTPQFNPYVNLTFPIKDSSQRKILGYFATVAAQSPHPGGFFLAIVLPDEIQRLLDQVIP